MIKHDLDSRYNYFDREFLYLKKHGCTLQVARRLQKDIGDLKMKIALDQGRTVEEEVLYKKLTCLYNEVSMFAIEKEQKDER